MINLLATPLKKIHSIEKNIRSRMNIWSFFTVFTALMVSVPVIVIFANVFTVPGELWNHLFSTVLKRYILNTIILVVGVGFLTILVGVFAAWLVTVYRFPGQNIFNWALILPLSIPAYIMAYTYAGMLDYTGPVQSFLRNSMGLKPEQLHFLDIMSIQGVVVIMTLSFYPYVYLITKASFQKQSAAVLEVSKAFGRTPFQTFLKVALPMARPAVVGGVSLVIMEVLNDFGVVNYYGVDTFTTGIFRAWFSMGDTGAATHLSGILLLFVFLLLLLERLNRGRARYDFTAGRYRPTKAQQLKKGRAFLAFLFCFIPVLFGFLIPFLQLSSWAILTVKKVAIQRILHLTMNSFAIVGTSSLLCITVSVFVAYSVRLHRTFLMHSMEKIVTLGYAIPGAIIALGVMIPFSSIDHRIDGFATALWGRSTGLLLSGTIAALVFAYLVRFIAVSYYPVESGFKKLCKNMDESSRSLGLSPGKTLYRVNMPLISSSILSGTILVFLELLKELPLTLILRPFNFNTLATTVFKLAGEEMLAESAIFALIIIVTALVPVLILQRFMNKE